MKKLKVVVIGAGSTYTPELINGFIVRKDELDLGDLYLMDIDREKMAIVSQLVIRMLDAANMDTNVVLTEDLDEAIRDADYVVAQIRVGMLDARILDEKIPLKYDLLGQETTGAGGFMNAMRTIPEIMKIAEKVKQLAPNAWFINFSNPSGLVAEAVLSRIDINMLGLCNGPINMLKEAKGLLPAGTKSFDYDFVGLNHLCWITSVYADGKEILSELLHGGLKLKGLSNVPQVDYDEVLFRAVPGLPISYLNYYYFRDKQIEKCKQAQKTRGEVCKDIEKELLLLYKNPELKTAPEELSKRGGALYSEAAVSIISAIENDKNEIHIVDVRNNGSYSFMDDNDIVETKCIVNKNGAKPIKLDNFNNEYIVGLMKAVKAYEKLAASAALKGSYEDALAALMVHPLIGDYDRAKAVLDDMLEANRKYLPQFFQKET